MLILTTTAIDESVWSGFIATIILVSSIIFTTLFYVAWQKYKEDKKSDESKQIDVDKKGK